MYATKKSWNLLCKSFNLQMDNFYTNNDFNLLSQVFESMPFCELLYCPLCSDVQFLEDNENNHRASSHVKAFIVVMY